MPFYRFCHALAQLFFSSSFAASVKAVLRYCSIFCVCLHFIFYGYPVFALCPECILPCLSVLGKNLGDISCPLLEPCQQFSRQNVRNESGNSQTVRIAEIMLSPLERFKINK